MTRRLRLAAAGVAWFGLGCAHATPTSGGLVDATGETWIVVGKAVFYCPPIGDERSTCVEARMVPLPAEERRAKRAAPTQ